MQKFANGSVAIKEFKSWPKSAFEGSVEEVRRSNAMIVSLSHGTIPIQESMYQMILHRAFVLMSWSMKSFDMIT